MIVAIDGPAGAGKSTVARRLAQRLGFRYLDTGAMYRALTWLAREQGIDPEDEQALFELASENPIELELSGRVTIGGHDVTTAIRSAEIDRVVPIVARHPAVRRVMRATQSALADVGNTVIEGRDIGTVVAKDATVKVYLDADPAVRAGRRQAERPEIGADALVTDLRERDARDAERTLVADDALLIDTTDLEIDDVVARIEQLVRERLHA
jgi:cytidylate kinase